MLASKFMAPGSPAEGYLLFFPVIFSSIIEHRVLIKKNRLAQVLLNPSHEATILSFTAHPWPKY